MKPLVFLHGWAQSSQVWYQQHDVFPDARFLNLPGHGGTDDVPADGWIEALAQQLPEEPCLLVGWSLGGMLALELIRQFPQRIAALVLVSATPCFRRKAGWQAGCDDIAFASFEAAVTSGSARLLNRFFALMLHADGLSRRDYHALAKRAVDRECPTSPSGLSDGLQLLATLDSRRSTAGISVPTLVLHGEQDAIVSLASGRWLATSIAGSQITLFPDCGHTPFLTQADSFNTTLINWWHSL